MSVCRYRPRRCCSRHGWILSKRGEHRDIQGGPVMVPAFGVVLRHRRERLSPAQEALAQRSGIGVRTIRDLETARVRRPPVASVRLLSDALHLDGGPRAVT
jgi:predicted transcriptional regulator